MSQNTNLKSLEALEASGTALATAQKLAGAINGEKQAAAALAPGLVDALVTGHLIQDHERVGAHTKLASHDGSMEVIGNLIGFIGQQKKAYEQKLAVANAGGSLISKEASADGNGRTHNPNYVGRRLGLGEKSAADIKFINDLGLGSQLGTEGQ